MKKLLMLLIGCSLGLAACAGARWERTSVLKNYECAVTVEQLLKDASSAQRPYAHPAQVDVNDIKKFMWDLSYTNKIGALSEGSKQSPVFAQAEVDRLAPIFAEHLAKINADQRLRFITFNQDPGVLLSESRKTEGILFVSADGRLNVAFNYVNVKRLPSETSAMYVKYSDIDPLSIMSTNLNVSAQSAYAERGRRDDGSQSQQWVVADIEKLKGVVVARPAPAANVGKTPEPSPGGAVSVAPVDHAASYLSPSELAQREIKGKLKYLKELKDEGLISEQDYTAKKAELLKKLD